MVEIAKLITRANELAPFFLRHQLVGATDFFIARKPEPHMDARPRRVHSSVRPSRGPNIWPALIANLLVWDHGLEEASLVLKPWIGILEAAVFTSRVGRLLLVVKHLTLFVVGALATHAIDPILEAACDRALQCLSLPWSPSP